MEHAAHYFTESGHVLFDEKQIEALRVAIAERDQKKAGELS